MIQFIGIGKDNAVTRSELCRLTGLSDRRMRHNIEELQFQGHRIINLGDGYGYYIAETKEEFEAYLRIEWHRIGKEMKKLWKMKNSKIFCGDKVTE